MHIEIVTNILDVLLRFEITSKLDVLRSFTSISDLCELTNLNPKSVSSRLSELQKLCYVDKTSIDRKIMFKITTQGINWLETILENRN